MNRILFSMPYHKLTQQIRYNATPEGISSTKLTKRSTPKTCHMCGSMNTTRIEQPIFQCHACGLVYSADLNETMNIAKNLRDQWLRNGTNGSRP